MSVLDLVARFCIASVKSALVMPMPMIDDDETKFQFNAIIIIILLRSELRHRGAMHRSDYLINRKLAA